MAIIKHIKSRNANYSNAMEYLMFQHDEKTNKPIYDEMGRMLLREEYYMDGVNCEPLQFDVECNETNEFFKKNRKKDEIKSHHYIISFDPDDCIDHGLTGEKAQALCLDFAKKNFPGYQALVVTHTDGHNGSGNIHTHIVINSVRKQTVVRQPYMDKVHEHEAGFKHRSTNRFLKHLQKEVMEMCEKEGFHQIDLLSPAAKKITQEEYRAQQNGQKNLDALNKKIVADGLKPTSTVFQTQKDFIRNAVEECAPLSQNFNYFQSLLFEKFNISVVEKRGRYSYLHPDREGRITEKSLGTAYGKEHLEKMFEQQERKIATEIVTNPIAIFYVKTNLRLVVDLQNNVKAMQNQAYARKAKITNLQQMANTLIYIQEHGYATKEDLENTISETRTQLTSAESLLNKLSSDLKMLNSEIHYTGQYLSGKRIYTEYVKARNKKRFRQQHEDKIKAYEDARNWLKNQHPDGKIRSLNSLKAEKEELLHRIESQKAFVRDHRMHSKELDIVEHNVNSILNMKYEYSVEKTKEKTQHKQKEETL